MTVTAPNPSSVGPPRLTTTSTYDGAGNLLSVKRPLYTSATAFTNQVSTYQRATDGRRTLTETDPLGWVTTSGYDLAGEPVLVTRPDGSMSVVT